MGRSAVAVCILFWQLPGLGYLVGLSGSIAITGIGGPGLTAVWSLCFVVAGLLMITVYRLKDEGDKNIVEIGALVVFGAAMLVYLLAIFARASTIDGRLAVLALLGSLLFNLSGRGFLLVRQIWYVRSIRKGRP